MDSYYVKNFLDSYKNKIHYYNVPSSSFSKIKVLSASEIIRLIRQAENSLNKINHYIKNLPNISSELLESLKQINLSLTSESYTFELNNSVEKILYDIEVEYNRQEKIKVDVVLPTELSRKINNLESAPVISLELLALIKQVKDLGAKDYSPELNDSVAKVLVDIESEYNRQEKISVNAVLSTELSRKVNNLESAPVISSELLALIEQVKDLGAKDYSPELNDSVAKVLADIESEYNRQQEKNSVINLIAMMESVSGKQITNASQYVQKFDGEIADFVSNINAAIEALRTKKAAIQTRLSGQKHENEDLINATIVALTSEKNAIQNRLNEQKRENETRIRAAIETLKASLKA